MGKTKKQYIDEIKEVFAKHQLSGSIIESTYTEAILNSNMKYCYIDSRIENHKVIKKEVNRIVEDFLNDYPEAVKPMYI